MKNHKNIYLFCILIASIAIFNGCKDEKKAAVVDPPVAPGPVVPTATFCGDKDLPKLGKVFNSREPTEATTELPSDITELFEDGGTTASDTAILFLTGGPIDTLFTNTFTAYSIVEGGGLCRFHNVYVYQANHFTGGLLRYIGGLAGPAAALRSAAENDISIEILARVIAHFKSTKKKVFVIGHSFGAFLITELLDERGDIADGYLALSGRLDIDEALLTGFRADEYWRYPAAGTDKQGYVPIKALETPVGHPLRGVLQLLLPIAEKRFTTELAALDLSKLVYVTAENDEAVGYLTDAERTFLTDKGATVVCVAGTATALAHHSIAIQEAPYPKLLPLAFLDRAAFDEGIKALTCPANPPVTP